MGCRGPRSSSALLARLAPEALFGVMFSIDTAPKSSTPAEVVPFAHLEPGFYKAAWEGSEPPTSPWSMESEQYGDAMHYCLCKVAKSSGETTQDVTTAKQVLSDLTKDPEFQSQAWPAADFALIWSWVQIALATTSCPRNFRIYFRADVRTSAGRVQKELDCSDVLSFAKAHVRVRHLEATGKSFSEDLQVMRYTSWQDWQKVFGSLASGENRRTTYAPLPWSPGVEPGELLVRKPHRRFYGKQPRSKYKSMFVRDYTSQIATLEVAAEVRSDRQKRFWDSEWGQKVAAAKIAQKRIKETASSGATSAEERMATLRKSPCS